MVNRWIQTVPIRKGFLHRQLGYPQTQTIPVGVLRKIRDQGVGSHVRTPGGAVPVTPLLKKRANFALNVRKPR